MNEVKNQNNEQENVPQQEVDEGDQKEQESYIAQEDIIEEYRRRQMIERMTGPVISLVIHVIVIGLFAVFLGRRQIDAASEIQFEVKDVDFEPIPEEVLDKEIEKIKTDNQEKAVPVMNPEIETTEVETQAMEGVADDIAKVDINIDLPEYLDVRPSRSPISMPGAMVSRGEGSRDAALDEFNPGQGDDTERTVVKALEWLKNNQNPDGSWSADKNLAAGTGLAVLTFLAHNETPTSKNYGETVQKGIEFLVDGVMKSGFEYTNYSNRSAYVNGIVAYALSEAYAMTHMPEVEPAMEKALRKIVAGQQEETGGFDYNYRPYSEKNRWDLSCSSWQFQALKAGSLAGAYVDGLDEAIERSVYFLKNHAFDSSKGFQYYADEPAGRRRPSTQGAGVLALHLFGEGDSSEVKVGLKFIEQYRQNGGIKWEDNFQIGFGSTYCYDIYYLTQAVFHAGKRHFKPWNEEMVPALVNNQRLDGSWRAPNDVGGWKGDPVINTTLNAMSLMVYYRFLPTYLQAREEKDVAREIFSLEDLQH